MGTEPVVHVAMRHVVCAFSDVPVYPMRLARSTFFEKRCSLMSSKVVCYPLELITGLMAKNASQCRAMTRSPQTDHSTPKLGFRGLSFAFGSRARVNASTPVDVTAFARSAAQACASGKACVPVAVAFALGALLELPASCANI